MIKMQKPNGVVLDVAESSVEYAKKLGWAVVTDEKPKRAQRGNSTKPSK